MKRDALLPTTTIIDTPSKKGGVKTTHPAFGLISVSRPQAFPGVTLFGSDLKHSHFISVTVQTADNTRELGRDWQHPTGTVLEFHMSESQWAKFVSGAGRSQATPVTLSFAPEEGSKFQMVPAILTKEESRKDQFNEEFKKDLKDALQGICKLSSDLKSILEEKSVSKVKLREISNSLERGLKNLPSNLDFAVESFKEATEEIVESAKAEIEAYTLNSVMTAGFKAIQEQENRAPQLPPL